MCACVCMSGCVRVLLRVSRNLWAIGASFRGYVKGIHTLFIVIIVFMMFFVCFSLIKGKGNC